MHVFCTSNAVGNARNATIFEGRDEGRDEEDEKPHSMVHWASNRRTVGRPRTISTNVTEGRMKTVVKTKAKKTNNQASFGGSILKANMEVEAAIELAHNLDETGMPCVCLGVILLGVLLDLPERV
jgi:hypothetical protein